MHTIISTYLGQGYPSFKVTSMVAKLSMLSESLVTATMWFCQQLTEDITLCAAGQSVGESI